MRLIQLPNVQSLAVAGMNLPFDREVIVSACLQEIRHLVKAIVFVLPIFIFASRDNEPDTIQESRDFSGRPRQTPLNLDL